MHLRFVRLLALLALLALLTLLALLSYSLCSLTHYLDAIKSVIKLPFTFCNAVTKAQKFINIDLNSVYLIGFFFIFNSSWREGSISD